MPEWSRIRLRLADRGRGLPRTVRELNFSLQLMSQLRSLGWHRSVRMGLAADRTGNPLPWYTYPAIEWLEPRIRASDSVFEFGAGQSTLWFASHAREVVSVEHNVAWYQRLSTRVGPNVSLQLRPTDASERGDDSEDSEYAAAIDAYPQQSFDVVAIDGVERVACIRHTISRLKLDGLLILDNSDRPWLRAGIELLLQEGFGRVDFHGFVPAYGTYNCTSVFWPSQSRWSSADAPILFHGF
jgi:hypothetical protein